MDKIIDKNLFQYLVLMGIWPNLNGYDVIKMCVKKVLAEPNKKYKISDVFEEIGKEKGKNPELISHSVINALKVSKKRKGLERLREYKYVNLRGKKLTPTSIITILETLIRKDLKKG